MCKPWHQRRRRWPLVFGSQAKSKKILRKSKKLYGNRHQRRRRWPLVFGSEAKNKKILKLSEIILLVWAVAASACGGCCNAATDPLVAAAAAAAPPQRITDQTNKQTDTRLPHRHTNKPTASGLRPLASGLASAGHAKRKQFLFVDNVATESQPACQSSRQRYDHHHY